MYKEQTTLFLICETALHAGSGDSLGIVDLPIQRERHTSFPKIEASSLKGALREKFRTSEPKESTVTLKIAFGSDTDDIESQAGALAFTDARLLLFPVKSMRGVFAWITCPRVLRQLSKDLGVDIKGIDDQPNENECFVLSSGKELEIGSSKKIVLEEYAFTMKPKENEYKIYNINLSTWIADNLFGQHSYWKSKAQTSIVVLNDDDFKDFVNLSTEVITRIKINNETGTVEQGALFTEEYLPSESVLYSMVFANEEFAIEAKGKTNKSASDNMNYFKKGIADKNIFQLGGNATLGKGIMRAVTFPKLEKSEN